MQRWQIGAARVTAVVESTSAFGGGFVQRVVIPAATPAALSELTWLEPGWLDEEGGARLISQAFLVESDGVRIVVDTCIGNDKERRNPAFHRLATGFLGELARAGAPPEEVDVVLCTHLHFDHTGWNTRLDDGVWVPTFPNARYLFARAEWEHWERTGAMAYAMDDSVRPVIEAGLVDLVDADHVVTSEVALTPTHGHTPGHVSVRIQSEGAQAIITGDAIHHPCQVGRPEWTGPADSDQAAAHRTRVALLDAAQAGDVVVIGTHFPAPTAGRVQADGEGRRLVPVIG